MASDSENRDQQTNTRSTEENTETRTTLSSDSHLHSGLLETNDQHLDKVHDYQLHQDKGVSSEQVNSNLHLGSHKADPVRADEELSARHLLELEKEASAASDIASLPEAAVGEDAAQTTANLSGFALTPDVEQQHRSSGSSSHAGILTGQVPGLAAEFEEPGTVFPEQSELISAARSTASARGYGQASGQEDASVEAQTSELSSIVDADSGENSVDENAAVGTSTGVSVNASVSEGSSVSYSLLDDANGLFSIDPVTGIVSVAGQLDAETATEHDIVVLATSSDGQTRTETFTIEIGDVDESDVSVITDTDATADGIAENASAGSQVGITALATDTDATASVSYAVDDPRFDIDSNGTVTVAAGASFDAETESSLNLTVTATSSDGSQSAQVFNLSVSDINEFSATDITDANSASNTISEGATVGDSVGVTVFADDADLSDTVTYSIDDDRFDIASDGTIQVAADADFDAETESSIDVIVTALSSDGSASQETFTITVSDANEYVVSAVSDTDSAANQISEDATAGTAVGITASASDADVSDSVTYSVDDNRFEVDADGIVSVASGAVFDAETEQSIDVEVTAQSTDGSTSTQTFTINVADVNETAVSAVSDTDSAANQISEDATAGTAVGITASASDADVSDSVTYYVDDNRFEVDADGIVSVASGAVFDAETEQSIDVEVTAQSTDGSTSTQTFTINVADVNETAVSAVSDTDSATNQISEDATAGTAVGITASASDADVADSVTYSVDDNRFEVDADGIVSVASGAVFDAETEQSIDVEVTAQSTDGSTSAQTFTINVADVNETAVNAVSDTDPAANQISEDATAGTAVGITASASDADVADSVTYSVDDNRFEVDADGIVSVASGAVFDAETEQSIDVEVTAQSTDGSTSTQTFTVQVENVNDNAPTGIQVTGQTGNLIQNGSFESFDVAIGDYSHELTDQSGAWTSNGPMEIWDNHNGVIATDGDQHLELDSDTALNSISQTVETSAGQVYDLSLDAVARTTSETSTVEIYWNGELVSSFDPDAGSWTNYDFQVVGTGGADTLEFRETAEDNDQYGALIDNVSLTEVPLTIAEGATGAVVGTVTTSDADLSDTHTYSLSDNRFEVVDNGSGGMVLKLKDAESLDRETEQSVTVTVTTTDSGGLTHSEDVTISIADVSEFSVSAITDGNADSNTVSETATAGDTVGVTASASDGDATDTVSYSVDDNRFDIADDGVLTVASGASFDAETESSVDVTVTVLSSDGSTSQETFTIAVADVNEYSVSGVVDADAGTNTIAEDATEGTSVGITASASDGDLTDTVSYTVDDARFDVASDGTVTVASGAEFDFESEPSVSITVTATSTDGSVTQETFDIDVTDVAETFELAAGQTVFVDEGVAEPTIIGRDNAETITAHDDGSAIYSGGGADTLHGGAGDDHLIYGTGADTVTGGDGDDFIDDEVGTRISTEDNHLDGGAGNDTIYGGGGDDTLIGGDGNDILSGEEDDDTLQGDGGNDQLSGGTGDDTAIYSGNRDDYTIVENLDGSFTITDTRSGSPDGTDTVSDVETFRFADGDVLTGDLIPEAIGAVSDADASANAVSENAVSGDSVGVTANAQDGNVSDTVSYSVDDARFNVAADGTVTVADNAEFNYETESSVTITVTATSSDGTSSQETFSIGVADVAETMQLADDGVTMTDTGVAETAIAGGTGDDTITAHDDGGAIDGGDGVDTVIGGAGDDTLDGGAGIDNDTLQGGEGSDTYLLRGDGRADIISDTGTAGVDRIVFSADTGTEFELEDTFNAATQGVEEIDGSAVSGETLRAQRSDAQIDWDFTGVTLIGVDQIAGRDRDDSITGSSGDDNILGGGGDDTLAGSEGDDTIDGGTGTDTVRYSGNRADYTVSENAGTITIVDTRSGSPDGTDTLTNVETFEFADGTFSVGDLVDLAPTDITLDANESLSVTQSGGGDAVVTGEIVSDGSGNLSVDHWSLSHDGGDLIIDVLAGGYESGSLDSQIYLYRDNGGGDFTLVAGNDDGSAGSDGSTQSYDSYLSLTGLDAGDYIVVIGGWPLSGSEALSTASDYPGSGSNTGPYQITISGDASVSGLAQNPVGGGDWGDPGNNGVVVSDGAVASTISAGTVVAGIETVADANTGDTFHFSFSDAGSGALQIDTNSGDISLAAQHDATSALSDTVTVEVTDSTNKTYQETVGIELGTTGDDTITGTMANDVVFGFGGNDTIDGGDGTDTVVLSGNQADYNIYDNGDGSQTVIDMRSGSPDGTNTVSNVEAYSFADGNVQVADLTYSTELLLSDANGSSNTIHEAADSGTEVGISVSAINPGGSTLTYELDDDRFTIDADGVVSIADHAFFDSQVESSIDLTVTATSSDGSQATETFTVSVSNHYDYNMTGGLADGSFTGSSAQSYSVDGIGGNDVIETGEFNDRVDGGSVAGNDQITGNGGRDLLFGEGGQDTIYGGSGDDIIVGGTGDDTLHGDDGSDLFMHGLGDGNDTIYGGTGSAWTDVIDLGGGPGVTAAGEYGTDWTVTITNGSVQNTDTENGRLELSEDAEGTIDFSDGTKVDFAQIEEIRW
ncbi:cadherin domain-containing protein [Roseibium sp. HPY-6]|uniref:cadherin domain-containing protein n=1 Tax=Roseibium sp. HPY-6 TaxID=3229852 RepID=UPI00338F8735